MSTPVAPAVSAPLYGGRVGHQAATAPLQVSHAPSAYTPAPVGSVLKGATAGVAYSETITAQNGNSPYTFAITAGALPTGMSMTSGGIISGTCSTPATYTFTVTVTDVNGYTGSQSFSITVSAAASSTTASVYLA